MDLSKGLTLKQQQQNFEVQQLWVPTTPAKTVPASSQKIQLPGPSWLKPAVLVANGAQDTATPQGLTSQHGSSSSSDLPSQPQDFKGNHYSLECWSPLLCHNVNVAFNVAGTSKVSPCPPLLVQIGDHQEMPSPQNKLLLKDSIPITSLPNYDSLPESTMSVSKTMTMSAPATPSTTERFYKRMHDKQPSSEVTVLVTEGAREENLMAKEVSSSQQTLEKLVSGKDIIVLSEEASEKPIEVQKSIIERKNIGIDLNVVTPKNRPQRKKHRPKVFNEGKPSRTPKSATLQPETEEQRGQKGSTSFKKKYSRRKKDVTQSPENALEEIVDAESKGEAKSVRRCLNFDGEGQQAFNEYSDAMPMFNKVLGAPVLDECDESAVTSSSMKETTDSIRVQYQVAVKPSAGTVSVSDLSSSPYQSKNECSKLLQIPVLPAEINKNMCASNKQMPFLKSSVKHFKALARETACLDLAAVNSQSSSEVAQRNFNPNRISDAPPKETKKFHLPFDAARVSDQKTIMHSYNLRGFSSNNYDAERKDSCTMRIHKRIRMENRGDNEENPNVSRKFICTSANTWKIKQLSNSLQDFTFARSQRFMNQDKVQDSRNIFSFDQAERYVQNHPALGTGEASLRSSRCSSRKLSPVKPSKKKNYNIGSLPEKNIVEGGSLSTKSMNGKNLNPETFSIDCHSSCYYNVSAPSNISLGTLVPFKNPLDDIVQKLRCLSIRSCDEVSSYQAPNAVVPYVGHGGMMVTYERNFHLIKRPRPRAKVDLDPESNKVWKLLMGKDCSSGDVHEHSDVDKDKWWVDERRVFRGRVDSFIARMHLVQGDRRFTQWKGSVVDSVVGVFLTQNVSDHLSSSAFMALAANFPLSRGKCSVQNGEKVSISTESQNGCIISFIDTPKLQRNILDHGSLQCSWEVNVAENGDQKETSNCSETVGSITTSSITYYSRQKGKGKNSYLHEKEATLYQKSTISGSGTNLAEMENIKLSEDADTSQNSAVSSQNSVGFHVPSNEHIGSNSFLNLEEDDLLSGSNDAIGNSSFTKLLQIAESRSFEEFYSRESGMISATKNQESNPTIEKNSSLWSQLDNSNGDYQALNAEYSLHDAVLGLSDMSPPTELCQFDDVFHSKIMVNNDNFLKDIRSHLLSTSCEIISGDEFEVMSKKRSESEGSVAESTNLHKMLSSSKTATNIDSCVTISKLTTQMEVDAYLYSGNHKNTAKDIIDATKNENPEQKDGNSIFKAEITHNAVQAPDKLETCRIQQKSVSNNKIERNLDVSDQAGSNLKAETCSFPIVSPETPISAAKTRKRKHEVENDSYDWESLRKEVFYTKPAQERSSTTMDSLDWEAVRIADVSKIAETIRERGMNNVLAERIKEFLNRLVRDHGSIDLEWLRDVPPDKVKDYLLSIRGLGLKSAECVRLLTLQQLAFPVDTNVGRICVRLGWVPLQPLPESLQLHLLELYPVLATIQKYLWPRLCKLDQRTLYELHYQMITFGKVFCTKRKPNCNSCPMRGECKHFASAFASARLALPAPEDKSVVVSFTTPIAYEKSHALINRAPLPQLEGSSNSQDCTIQNNCEPIVEEPESPEPECPEALERAIEDAFYEDPDEIPTIKLNLEEFTQNIRNYMEENMELQDASLSKALVALTPEATSIPMPKLKNVSRLRTEHQVYEIPDTHPLLEGVDQREPDDPSPYLLAIWTPGETAQSTEPPKTCCNLQDPDQLCERSTCFACNSIREAESHEVRGTLLIPCRTAMRGSFPLNGTYFQVNEVFADHYSSYNPIYVPRAWIWNLPRRTVYFGTSIPTIFRGLTTEVIQQCFWRGFVCVRGFDRVTRAPKPLYARLHFPASKAPKNRKAAESKVEK
ncbi:protein ROS1A [Dendrobium catenatum]|uniref:Transcriptional activator DEMETER n=1 Tax=Dendrobium catenatum TaxID=906689 RepID=A0A2I0WYT2_9ASPA|nr:protein ROS1A [Dendrobium catenatum]XP_020696303.1 protein ROS1A [Dendrobium catenatum]PKU80819.1 Transcriptional activator DEMETER [Dendrobium catenatum]